MLDTVPVLHSAIRRISQDLSDNTGFIIGSTHHCRLITPLISEKKLIIYVSNDHVVDLSV